MVVFDNADAPRALSRFLPMGPGQVLITSRNPAWQGIAPTLEVREFRRAESIALLHRLAQYLTAAEAGQVADAVGDLPLAIEQAGSLMADTGMTADKYLRLLTERAHDVLDHDPSGVYSQSLAASWAVAFDRLAADAPIALDLLTVVAWCGPEPVPLELLTDHPMRYPPSYGRSRRIRWCWPAARKCSAGAAWQPWQRAPSRSTGFRRRCSAPGAEDRRPQQPRVGPRS